MPEGPRPAPPAGTARCTIGGTTQTHKWACVFWLNITSANPQSADLVLLAGKVSQAYDTHLKPIVEPLTIMNNVLIVWTPTAGSEIIASDTTARTGTLGDTAIKNASSCYVISHRTGAYYRGGHSRSYLPGVGQSLVTNGSTITGAGATAAASGWSGFANAINTGPSGGITGSTPGTVRFQSKGAWLVPPTFVPWQTHACRTTLGTQRGRLTE